MTPAKYNFYIGHALQLLDLYSSHDISDSGDFLYNVEGKCATSFILIPYKKSIFIDLANSNYYNMLFFYNENRECISCMRLCDIINTVVVPPDNSKYYAIRFTEEDEVFTQKREVNFIYYIAYVKPHFKELNKKYKKENGQEFFRESLDGKINLFDKDYGLVTTYNIEDELIFIIDKYNINLRKWVNYYKGKFSKTDCKFDHSRNKCELKIEPLDDYSEIINKYENTYDLIQLAPETSNISIHKRSLIQIYIAGSNTITSVFGGTYWENEVNEAIGDGTAETMADTELKLKHYHFSRFGIMNEFYVKKCGLDDFNGVYAGSEGLWQKANKNYVCKAEELPDEIGMLASGYIRLYRNGKLMYQSREKYTFASEFGIFIYSDVEMVGVNPPYDVCFITSPFIYAVYGRLLCDVDTIELKSGVKNTFDIPSDDFVSDNKNYKKCIGLKDFGTILCTAYAVDEPTRYGKNDDGKYFTNAFFTDFRYNKIIPISRNFWANASIWYVYSDKYASLDLQTRKRYTTRDNYSICEVIKALLKKIDPSIKHENTVEYSNFLYGPSMPIYPYNRFYVFITQKTNILKGNYDQPAQKAEISLKNVMDMLRDCFRCYWYIDNGKLKIEHISFFNNGHSYTNNVATMLDFTKLSDQFNNKPALYFQSEIEYDKSDLSSRYEFNWMDEATNLFDGVIIDIKSNYVQKNKTEEINISQFSSDVDYMLLNPSNFSNDGFALLCPVKNGEFLELPIVDTQIRDEDGLLRNVVIQNFYAAWAYLVRFYLYDMPAQQFECNVLGFLYARGLKLCMKHTIEFMSEEDLDKLELIKTEIGNGKIDEMSFNMDTRQAKISLLYKPQ